MPENRPLRVFLCHSSNDKPAVRELYQRLSAEGWMDIWLDEEKLYPGQDWDLEIEKAVEATDVVIVCLSNNSVSKEGYVQRELRFVLRIADYKPEGAIFVVPVRLNDCPMPRRLAMWQYTDLFPDKREDWAYERLLGSLKMRAKNLGLLANPVDEKKIQEEIDNKKAEEEYWKRRREADERRKHRFGGDSNHPKQTTIKKTTGSHLQSETNEMNDKREVKPTNFRPYAIGVGIILLAGLGFSGIRSLANNSNALATEDPSTIFTQAALTVQAQLNQVPTPSLGIGSTMAGADGMTLLYVPAGEFIMGSEDGNDDEKPVHTVNLDAFWIDQTEVTNAMYAKCVEAGDCTTPSSTKSDIHDSYYGNSEFDDYPVIYVSWNQANDYCSWAGRRLPTEAEWEKTARGADGRTYPWENSFVGENVNFCDANCPFNHADKSFDDGYADVSPVGNYPNGASEYGALDMAGNVWEWVSSLYQPYPYDANDGREDLSVSVSRVLRGGSWDSLGYYARSAPRNRSDPTYTGNNIGFRCSLSQ